MNTFPVYDRNIDIALTSYKENYITYTIMDQIYGRGHKLILYLTKITLFYKKNKNNSIGLLRPDRPFIKTKIKRYSMHGTKDILDVTKRTSDWFKKSGIDRQNKLHKHYKHLLRTNKSLCKNKDNLCRVKTEREKEEEKKFLEIEHDEEQLEIYRELDLETYEPSDIQREYAKKI